MISQTCPKGTYRQCQTTFMLSAFVSFYGILHIFDSDVFIASAQFRERFKNFNQYAFKYFYLFMYCTIIQKGCVA